MWCARQCSKIFSYLDSFNTQVFFERGSIIMTIYTWKKVSWVTLGVKNPPASAGDLRDMGSILEWGRYPEGVHGNPLQYTCLENPMDRRACRATVHRVTVSHDWRNSTHAPALILLFQLIQLWVQCLESLLDFSIFTSLVWYYLGFSGGSAGKESACNVGDLVSISGLGRSPGAGHGNPLQYSHQENLMNRGAWGAMGHRVTKRHIWSNLVYTQWWKKVDISIVVSLSNVT